MEALSELSHDGDTMLITHTKKGLACALGAIRITAIPFSIHHLCRRPGCLSEAPEGTLASTHHPAIGRCPSLRASGSHGHFSPRLMHPELFEKAGTPFVFSCLQLYIFTFLTNIVSIYIYTFYIAPFPLRN